MSGRGFSVAPLALGAAGALVWLLGMPGTAHGAEMPNAAMRVECPLWLEPGAFKANHPPAGWTAVMPQAWRLQGGALLHGAPDESAYLKPYDAKTTKRGFREIGITRWKLSPPHPFETWLSCAYGPLELFKRIPADATECTAASKLERGAFMEVVFVCK